MTASAENHYDFIDCVRGYAVLLVILCHASYLFTDLPNPVHRFVIMGWYGVQLFFLASTLTLLMSREREIAARGRMSVKAFFLRRFFRIAPAYYVASFFYFVLDPPATGFNLWHAAQTWLFIDNWSPAIWPQPISGWRVVPGSWSVSAEFTFYALFPFLATFITSLRRAAALMLVVLAIAAVANPMMLPSLIGRMGAIPADNFLFFWFPNQLCVFVLGFCLYFLMQRDSVAPRSIFARHPNVVAVASVGVAASISFVPLPHWITWHNPLPPTFLIVTAAMIPFILAISRARRGLLLNRPVMAMGRVSFSAYLAHYAVMTLVETSPVLHDTLHATGWGAIVRFPFVMLAIFVMTGIVSWVSSRLIENPGIAIGKHITAALRTKTCSRPAPSPC